MKTMNLFILQTLATTTVFGTPEATTSIADKTLMISLNLAANPSAEKFRTILVLRTFVAQLPALLSVTQTSM
jgi:hypothetical protein